MPNQVLTLYNSGTAYDTTSPDLIALLARTTSGVRGVDWDINPGPGSAQQARRDLLPRAVDVLGGGSSVLFNAATGMSPGQALGQAFGAGISESIAISLDLITRTTPAKVNFCGWSRGAITCLMTASALSRSHPSLPVNLFLFDPVIGDPAANAALWRGESTDVIGANVREIAVVQMLNEDRFIMQAHLPASLAPGARRGLSLHPLPGQHASAVEPSNGPYAKVFNIGNGLAKAFLNRHGTRFTSYSPYSDAKFLELYSTLWRALRSTPSVPLGNNRYELREQQRQQVPSDRSFSMPNLFFNEHHVQVMQAQGLFPTFTRLIAYALIRGGTAHPDLIAAGRAELERQSALAGIPETLAVLGWYLSRIRPE